MKSAYRLICKEFSSECEEVLFQGINANDAKVKGIDPVQKFCLSIENDENIIFGGITCFILYGCLYIDMLWVDDHLRKQGWGNKLINEAEKIGQQRGCTFAAVNTMDWQALSFYQKLGYAIEFTREGFAQNSQMFMLRKNF